MTGIIEIRTIGLEAAGKVVAAAVAEAEGLGVAVCVAVVDQAGHLLAYGRMDGAALLCGKLAQDKAYSVASFGGLPTHEWWDQISDEPALVHGLPQAERLVIFAGGVPIVHKGQAVGAVGVSGGSTEQDKTVAEAGARALAPKRTPRKRAVAVRRQ